MDLNQIAPGKFSFAPIRTRVLSTPISVDQVVTISFLPAGVDELFGPNSPIAKYLESVATLVLERASQLVGTRYSGHHTGPRLKDSGHVVAGTGGIGDIGSFTVVFQNEHAYLHHQGTKGHFIGGPGTLLVNKHNPARTGDGQFFARGTVQHHGSDPNPYLVNAARELGLPVQSPSIKTGAISTVPIPRFVPSA